jgi:hypothetical protein
LASKHRKHSALGDGGSEYVGVVVSSKAATTNVRVYAKFFMAYSPMLDSMGGLNAGQSQRERFSPRMGNRTRIPSKVGNGR